MCTVTGLMLVKLQTTDRIPYYYSCIYWVQCLLDLSEPADVYSDWIDACEAANNWQDPLLLQLYLLSAIDFCVLFFIPIISSIVYEVL